MRLAFMGTPAFSVPALGELLAAGHEIVAVYTQPPRPSGRGHRETKSPVHQFAESHGINVRTPINFKSAEAREEFAALELDVAIVVAYGLILPQAILDAPRHGCLNLHASLLPRWRGAAPIQRAIMAGDKVTGVQVMQMEKGLDTGPILLGEQTMIEPFDTAESLTDRLSQIGAHLLSPALAALSRGGLVPTPQAEQGVTYAYKISSEEARIDWSQSSAQLDCHIRGLSPFPGAWCEMRDADGKQTRVKLLMSRIGTLSGALPGTILSLDNGITIAAGDGSVTLTKLQRAGKTVQEANVFLNGFPLKVGEKVF